MQQREYFERLIRQIGQAVAQIESLVKEGRIDDAVLALDATWASVLSLKRHDVERLNDATVLLLLGAKAPYARPLFEAQASIEDARGATQVAAELRRRAAELKPAGMPSR
jgi:hypothetical protein